MSYACSSACSSSSRRSAREPIQRSQCSRGDRASDPPSRRHLHEARNDPLRDVFDPERTRYHPADPALVDYRDHFVDSARAFDRFPPSRPGHPVWQQWPARRRGDHAMVPHALSLVRNCTGTCSRAPGRSVTFIWYDLPTGPSEDFDVQNQEIGRVLRRLRRALSRAAPSVHSRRHAHARPARRLSSSTIWLSKTSPGRAAPLPRPTDRELLRADELRTDLIDALPRLRALVRAHALRCGGRSRRSPVGQRALPPRRGRGRQPGCDLRRRAGVGGRVHQRCRCPADRPRPRVCDVCRTNPGVEDSATLEVARAEFEQRRHGTDATSYQRRATSRVGGSEPRREILVPLSVMFDTAALGRHHLFADSREWLVETVAAVLAPPMTRSIVRQHPSERRALERSRFDAWRHPRPSVRRRPTDSLCSGRGSCQYIRPARRIARLVLPFVSTIGIEAAALGKPVVVGGAVLLLRSRASYGRHQTATNTSTWWFAVRAVSLPELPNQTTLAWRCFYLNAVCQRVWTDFTCQPVELLAMGRT